MTPASALADLIAEETGLGTHKTEASTGQARAVAELILERFDLHPKASDLVIQVTGHPLGARVPAVLLPDPIITHLESIAASLRTLASHVQPGDADVRD